MNIAISIGITVVSLGLLITAANLMLKSAIGISQKLNISPLIVGSTIVAVGTGLPTIAVSVVIALTNPASIDVAIGNVLGTTIVNLGLALGIPAFITTIVTKYAVYEKELPLYLIMMGLLTAFALDRSISIAEGVGMLLTYVLASYIIYQYAKRERSNGGSYHSISHLSSGGGHDGITPNEELSRNTLSFMFGFILLLAASFALGSVSGALSEGLGISEYVLGITVFGIGTSLPTIVASIQAARKNYIDIVLGNVFGGNIVNIGLGIGLPALMGGIHLNAAEMGDIQFTHIYNVVIILLVLVEMRLLGENKALSRISGSIIVLCYFGYLAEKLWG